MRPVIFNSENRVRLGVVLGLFWFSLIFLYDPLMYFYDRNVRSDATVFAAVMLRRGDPFPDVEYAITVNRRLNLHFSTWLNDHSYKRYCTGGGDWTYTPEKHRGEVVPFELVTWLAADGCVLPSSDYRACVDYTNLSEVGPPYWGPFCSEYIRPGSKDRRLLRE